MKIAVVCCYFIRTTMNHAVTCNKFTEVMCSSWCWRLAAFIEEERSNLLCTNQNVVLKVSCFLCVWKNFVGLGFFVVVICFLTILSAANGLITFKCFGLRQILNRFYLINTDTVVGATPPQQFRQQWASTDTWRCSPSPETTKAPPPR